MDTRDTTALNIISFPYNRNRREYTHTHTQAVNTKSTDTTGRCGGRRVVLYIVQNTGIYNVKTGLFIYFMIFFFFIFPESTPPVDLDD